jgi:hypothetical protein
VIAVRHLFSFVDSVERCSSYDFSAGRCQLETRHGGPHCVRGRDAYLTWDLHAISHWSAEKPPPWIVSLDWAPGLHPAVGSSWTASAPA